MIERGRSGEGKQAAGASVRLEPARSSLLEPLASKGGPTHVRYSVIVLALLIDMMSYMDRVCISVAAPSLREEFALSPAQMGMVFSAFSLAYFLFLTPWGVAADRWGARWIVTAAILWWSGFTAMTAVAWSLLSLLTIRFLFGAVEAALSPAIASAFKRWTPISERATAFGAFLSGGRIGGAIAPPIAAYLVIHHGWRSMFVTFAVLGLVWAPLWFWWYRNHPREHPRVNRQELEVIAAGEDAAPAAAGTAAAPWGQLLRSRPLLLLLAVAFGYTFMWQFYITWYPTYLIEDRGMVLAEAAGYAGLPFFFGIVANWVGGVLTDWLSRTYGPRAARRRLGFWALLISGLLLLAGLFLEPAGAAAVVIASAAGAGDMALGAFWTSAVEIGGSAAGAVSGLMNSASNFGGFVSPTLMGWIFQQWHDWNLVLLAAVASNIIAAFLWLGVNPPSSREARGVRTPA